MKRILIAVLLSLLGTTAYAQQWDQVNGSMQVKSGPTAPLVIIDQTNTGQKILSLRNNGTEKCYVDTSGNLNCAGTFTLTGQFLAADGSASAPSYSFASETDNGFYRVGNSQIGIADGGAAWIMFGNSATRGVNLGSAGVVSWADNANPVIGTSDVILSRGAANRLDWGAGDSAYIPSGGLGVGVVNTTAGVIQSSVALQSATFQGTGSGVSVANVGANSCGTTAATIAGNQVSGVITVGAGAGTQCRVTFSTAAPVARDCTVTDSTTTIATRATYVDTTNTDFFGAFVAGDNVTYICVVR